VDIIAKSTDYGVLTTSNTQKIIEKAKEEHAETERLLAAFRSLCPVPTK